MLARPAATAIAVIGATLLLAGCGVEGKAVADVKPCLKKAGLKLEKFTKKDKKEMVDGVSGATSFENMDELVFAAAGHAKTDKIVKKFNKEAKGTVKELEASGQKGFAVKTGSDGKYVWAVAGKKDAKAFKAAQKCIEP